MILSGQCFVCKSAECLPHTGRFSSIAVHFLKCYYANMMHLRFTEYVEKQLKRATYKNDKRIGAWAGWIEGVPGVYAQAPTVEQAREDLASALEEYILLSVRDKQKIRDFPFSRILYATAD